MAAITALRPDGRFVSAGVKLVRGWRGMLLNPLTRAAHLVERRELLSDDDLRASGRDLFLAAETMRDRLMPLVEPMILYFHREPWFHA